MTCTVVDFAKDRTVYNITGASASELDNKLNLFFTSEGYSVKSNKKEGETVYKKGNFVLRILFGAFVKYYQVLVVVKKQDDLFSVLVQRDGNGMSGGVIGMNQVRKEFARLNEGFKVYFSS